VSRDTAGYNAVVFMAAVWELKVLELYNQIWHSYRVCRYEYQALIRAGERMDEGPAFIKQS